VRASDLKASNLADRHHFACSPASPVVEGSSAVTVPHGAQYNKRKARMVNTARWVLKRSQAVSAHGR
jgi:hypothetical protein